MTVAAGHARALEVAIEAAAEAAAHIRRAWTAGGISFKTKSTEIDLVTVVDQEAEDIVSGRLRAAFPGDRLVLEEGGEQGDPGPRCWYVDPLDGTTNFAHGFPHFAVTVALEEAGETVVGVVHDVIRDECYAARRGGGATVDGVTLAVSRTEGLDRALLATGFPYDRRENPDNNLREAAAFWTTARGIRRPGAASLDLASVARGWFDGYWEMRLNPWDVAAGALLVEEAGGRVTDYSGGPMDPGGGEYVASNGQIHDEMLEVIQRIRG